MGTGAEKIGQLSSILSSEEWQRTRGHVRCVVGGIENEEWRLIFQII